MIASVFIATSLDGFIAREDGTLDWLPPVDGESIGYYEFIATVDAIVIGRKRGRAAADAHAESTRPEGLTSFSGCRMLCRMLCWQLSRRRGEAAR